MAFLRACCRAALIAVLCLGFSGPLMARQGLQLYEDKIKAGLLYNFLKYIDWPEDSTPGGAPIAVCLFGGDPFSGQLQPMEGRTVNQHSIHVREVNKAEEAEACHLLYINAEAVDRWPDLRKALARKPVLTVSDYPAFADAGGMIEFTHTGEKISAVLNSSALQEANLRVESRLMNLVKVVR